MPMIEDLLAFALASLWAEFSWGKGCDTPMAGAGLRSRPSIRSTVHPPTSATSQDGSGNANSSSGTLRGGLDEAAMREGDS